VVRRAEVGGARPGDWLRRRWGLSRIAVRPNAGGVARHPSPLATASGRRQCPHVPEPAREAAELDWVTFHSFRHTCASLLFESGKNIRQVSDWLGHDGGLGDVDFLDAAVAVGGNTGATHDVRKWPQTCRVGRGELERAPCKRGGFETTAETAAEPS
jgi:integrase-like protein